MSGLGHVWTAPRNHVGDIVRLTLEARLQRVGREMKLVVHDAEHRAEADPGLLRLIARAHDFQERLIQDPESDRAGHCQPGAAHDRLPVSPPAAPVSSARYLHGDDQRPTPASAQCKAAHASGP